MAASRSFFCGRRPLPFGGSHLETPDWTSRDSIHHRQSVSAGKTNAIPTEPSGRLYGSFKVSDPLGWDVLYALKLLACLLQKFGGIIDFTGSDLT